MKTWRRAPSRVSRRTGLEIPALACGGCRAAIQPNAPMLELQIGEAKRVRCEKCAKRLFGDDPPTPFPDDAVTVPAPSLPLDTHRGPDFVTPGKLAQSVRFNDYRSRAAGERD